ncbi:acyl dehydratase [Amycolatopsis carbonis]|uniref:Acyl dehydratase n=1 Tax=Amycolatopsis carbonis TaxID=715471 RepID=A0A9Y2IGW4_9PSEU|nr:acyl dehydratase [Amycolatopsis sp. 2-15]WIX78348.1 acyl dehydratase [Amycolatopsis sp. 2-15]
MTVELPSLRIEATTTFVVSTALATRDFQDVHHDRDAAVARGSKDIFLTILTDTGLVQRFVSEWAGLEALIRSIKIRLGVPCYAGGHAHVHRPVVSRDGADVELAVSATGSLGEHLTGTVSLTLAGGAS